MFILRIAFCWLCLTLPVSLSAQPDSETQETVPPSTKTASLKNLQGAWECTGSEYNDPNLMHDAVGPWYLASPDFLLIEGDSAYFMNYPCELVSRHHVSVGGGSISFSWNYERKGPSGHNIYTPRLFTSPGGTVSLYDHSFSMHNGHPESYYSYWSYQKTTMDADQIALLKRETVDTACLTGEWDLVKTFDSGHDGWGIVPYDFPFKLADVLKLSPEGMARKSRNHRIIYLKADGKMRPFYIHELSSDGNYMELETMRKWYQHRSGYIIRFER